MYNRKLNYDWIKTLRNTGLGYKRISHLTNYPTSSIRSALKIMLLKGGKRNNEYSLFKSLMRNIKNRCKNKKIEYYITVEDLKELWDKQDGKCFYSGIKMNLPLTSSGFSGKRLMENCSVDRIDSNKLYRKDNIVLCCYGTNIGKGIWSKEEYINFCKLVSKYNNGDEKFSTYCF